MLKRRMNIKDFARLCRVPENDDGAGGAGGDGGESKNKGGTGGAGAGDDGDKSAKYVSREDHERALADLNKFKAAAAKAAQEKKDADTAALKEQNKWKELAEQKEAEAKEAREKTENIEKSYLEGKKFDAVKAKCEALGIRPEALSDLEMLDLGDIRIETTSTGKINVLNADKFAAQLKSRKPHWFSDKGKPNVNTNGTRVIADSGDGAITAKDLLKAEAEGRKSGDLTAYRELHAKYQQQRVAGSRR